MKFCGEIGLTEGYLTIESEGSNGRPISLCELQRKGHEVDIAVKLLEIAESFDDSDPGSQQYFVYTIDFLEIIDISDRRRLRANEFDSFLDEPFCQLVANPG